MTWKKGQKLVHRAQPAWGVGLILEVGDEGRRIAVRFAGRDGVTVVSGRDPALAQVPDDTPLDRPEGGLLARLASSDVGPASAFVLRTRVARLEAMRRADSLGALLSSRVHVLPHQVGAAGRILAERSPRFVLADEVGLGKTIEAGLVFSGMRQLGVADRVLVVVPEHLAFQWLAELFHKFNALFTLLTTERIAELGGPAEAVAKSRLAIVSQERLGGDGELAALFATAPADLLIVDEAHHLATDALFERVAPIARSAFGVLLLTATPVRLDPREYFRLLSLVEPVPSTTLDRFLARLEAHEAFASVARQVLAGGNMEEALSALRALAPEDPLFQGSQEAKQGKRPRVTRARLLDHLATRYSLSSRLIRNRRVKVGAFTRRVLRRHEVAEGGKLPAAAALCAGLARSREKVLVFGGDVATLRTLQGQIADRERLEALLYDDAPTLEARDRMVARFRDPDGPMVLLSGESGGEGRNFQFSCHLVCLDLPDSPLTLEQRIGRLDRLGQTRPVEVHVLAEPGEEAFLADLYEKEIGIFEEPVGGLDAVLATLPEELDALRRKRSDETREAFRRKIAERVAEGRRAQHEGYDPLLDVRSASLPELTKLVTAAFERLGEEPPDGTDGGRDATAEDPDATTARSRRLEASLQTLSRWLEEELEELTVEAGRRVGMEVDTDENVHPFETAFTFGTSMRIEALPGMEMPEEERTHLGSFWRETAVAHEELEWFATGHRLVEALLELVRDGDAGRTAVVRSRVAPRAGALYARYRLRWPAPADLHPGARVPSRQASRYLDEAPISALVELAPGHRLVEGGAARLEVDVEAVADGRVGPPPAVVLEAAGREADRAAQSELARRVTLAVKRLGVHGKVEETRLIASAREGGAPKEAVGRALVAELLHREIVEKALRGVKLDLDAVALVVP
ncbi:MAG TPA: SNF2-related protein [Anaeromyxobacteraceae bacterium]|nr:SNF2-related protein [Anaeromyxobacteraceae bacterium]